MNKRIVPPRRMAENLSCSANQMSHASATFELQSATDAIGTSSTESQNAEPESPIPGYPPVSVVVKSTEPVSVMMGDNGQENDVENNLIGPANRLKVSSTDKGSSSSIAEVDCVLISSSSVCSCNTEQLEKEHHQTVTDHNGTNCEEKLMNETKQSEQSDEQSDHDDLANDTCDQVHDAETEEQEVWKFDIDSYTYFLSQVAHNGRKEKSHLAKGFLLVLMTSCIQMTLLTLYSISQGRHLNFLRGSDNATLITNAFGIRDLQVTNLYSSQLYPYMDSHTIHVFAVFLHLSGFAAVVLYVANDIYNGILGTIFFMRTSLLNEDFGCANFGLGWLGTFFCVTQLLIGLLVLQFSLIIIVYSESYDAALIDLLVLSFITEIDNKVMEQKLFFRDRELPPDVFSHKFAKVDQRFDFCRVTNFVSMAVPVLFPLLFDFLLSILSARYTITYSTPIQNLLNTTLTITPQLDDLSSAQVTLQVAPVSVTILYLFAMTILYHYKGYGNSTRQVNSILFVLVLSRILFTILEVHYDRSIGYLLLAELFAFGACLQPISLLKIAKMKLKQRCDC